MSRSESSHDHGHGHKDSDAEMKDAGSHDHGHKHQAESKDDDIPAWKKKAMEMGDDPMAAPFGGNWNVESSLSAKDKMQE